MAGSLELASDLGSVKSSSFTSEVCHPTHQVSSYEIKALNEAEALRQYRKRSSTQEAFNLISAEVNFAETIYNQEVKEKPPVVTKKSQASHGGTKSASTNPNNSKDPGRVDSYSDAGIKHL